MLVLSRKRNQQITIDGNIRITVLEVSRSRVRLGIEAPREIPVYRPGETEPGRESALVSVAV
ncbi:MAG: carbon storage regulator [Planctomycetaceae bacterium]|nr:carbon storage regulator [Planctomycetaceae bacterium]